MTALKEIYASIESPWFPASARAMITTDSHNLTVEAEEPEDEALTSAGLWAVVVTAASGYV